LVYERRFARQVLCGEPHARFLEQPIDLPFQPLARTLATSLFILVRTWFCQRQPFVRCQARHPAARERERVASYRELSGERRDRISRARVRIALIALIA